VSYDVLAHNPLNPPYLKGETRKGRLILRGELEGRTYLNGTERPNELGNYNPSTHCHSESRCNRDEESEAPMPIGTTENL
jgi:hypothetical protein